MAIIFPANCTTINSANGRPNSITAITNTTKAKSANATFTIANFSTFSTNVFSTNANSTFVTFANALAFHHFWPLAS